MAIDYFGCLNKIDKNVYDVKQVGKIMGRDTKFVVTCSKCNTVNKQTTIRAIYKNVNDKKDICTHCRLSNHANKINESKKLTYEEVRDLINSKDNLILLSTEYARSSDKLDIWCEICNESFKMRYNDIQQGHGCPNCKRTNLGNMRRYSIDFVRSFIEKHGNNEPGTIKLLSESYNDNDENLKFLCTKCNQKFERTFNSFKNQYTVYCPHCKSSNVSKNETMIMQFLRDMNVEFEHQVKFDDCIGTTGIRLPFDFKIYREDSSFFLLEYDGIQHFQPIDAFGGEEGYKKTLVRDGIKNEYVKTHNLELIRVSYKHKKEEIQSILKKLL